MSDEHGGRPIAVLGAGSWGTALAVLLAGQGHDVVLWAFEDKVADEIKAGENRTYLPGFPMPPTLRSSSDLHRAIIDAHMIVSVTPSQFVRSVISEGARSIPDDALVVSASKGIETDSLMRMDELFSDLLPGDVYSRFSVLSGPSFAKEVAEGAPTAVVVASRSESAAQTVQSTFQTERFRVYTNDDVVGVELGGALKNVIALAAGVAAGLGYGHNTRAALITRGLAEMTRLGAAMGARRSTFAGLAGMGDLVLTCTGDLSRNRTVGFRLGRGESLEEILSDMTAVAEGVKTAKAAVDLGRRHGVELPICEEVLAILTEDRAPEEAVRALMLRDPKPEDWA